MRIACGTTTRRVMADGCRPSALRRFGLALGYAANTGAHDFGDEGRGIEG